MRGTFTLRTGRALLIFATLAACSPRATGGSGPPVTEDASGDDASDATTFDGAQSDVTPSDGAQSDTAPSDDATDASLDVASDASPDTSAPDASAPDASPPDASPPDASPPDASPTDAPPTDAGADVAADASTCRSDRDCSGAGQVCDLTRMTCVDCLRDVDCSTAGQQCLGFRCVTPTRCTSSRTCPGQVCDTTRGACVDCVTALDCPVGEVCFSNACGAAPPPCRSDRDCSSRMQVCNLTRMTCVDCAADTDCPMGRFCDADGSCVPQVCAPDSASCADETSRRVCSSDGRRVTVVPCPPVSNGTARCVDGACAPTCSAGFADCDMNPSNGCEVNTQTSATNCGACGTACPTAGGTASCAAGACALTCLSGLGNCDGNAANGCETNTASSASNCGRCGNSCGAGQSCASGVCVTTSCPTGRTLCGATCVDLSTDLSNCGACGRACVVANGAPTCMAGTCQVASCLAGFANCNASVADGCEANLTTSSTNCAACGRVCSLANATSSCVASSCQVATCLSGFANCNSAASDGCEANLATSSTNCGACGVACGTGRTCQAGACVTNPCPTGQTLCGTTCRNTATDPINCGGCSVTCGTGRVCLSGVCTTPPLRFTMTWSTTADLDLAIVTPRGIVINYSMPSGDGGNHGGDSTTLGPETITWSTTPPTGTYSVCAIPYRISATTSFSIQALRAGSVVTTRTGSYSTSAPTGTTCSRTSPYRIFDFTY